MSKFNRRQAIALAAVGPFARLSTATPGSAYAWPHPEVGIPAPVTEGGAWVGLSAMPAGGTFAGGWFGPGGQVIDPGRFYTPEEWAKVGDDVSVFLWRRNAIILQNNDRGLT